MGKEKFKNGLIEMGYQVDELHDNWLKIKSYTISSGRFENKNVEIAFDVPADFESTEPHGPHIRPLLFPVNTSSQDPNVRMHGSPLGNDWGHLSRPFPNWKKGHRSVKRYMQYIDHLLEKTL